MIPNIDNIQYRCYPYNRKTKVEKSVEPIGLDTEAYLTGECFMICTSLGDTFQPENFPDCLFSRKYRNKSFVVYNLKYDEGAFIQRIPEKRLNFLRVRGWCYYKKFTYKIIGYKCLTIRKGKNAIHIYDMFTFYGMSLNAASKTFLGEEKDDIQIKTFWPYYVALVWDKISAYCIKDAVLVGRLSSILIKRFESYGVYPKKLYSVAYISYQYFRKNTSYVTVKRYWQNKREVIQYALESYNGGKFEVTEKGTDYYYEYDIVSAYPFEISNLVDITWARTVKDKRYRKDAIYGFIRCVIKVPVNVFSPCPVKRGSVNTYPAGTFERTITKAEYEYLISNNCDVKIKDAYWIFLCNKQYPYKREIERLVRLKTQFKREGKDLDYATIKKIMNSLYGKFVQLIDKGDYYEASSCWNPIYGSIITANCRIRVSSYQQAYQDVVAVHTDSIITKKSIQVNNNGNLGSLKFEKEGEGIILGSGIYQIGDKVKFRGYPLKTSLFELIHNGNKTVTLSSNKAYTWKSVVHRGLPLEMINRFEQVDKKVNINFDTKRLWLKDWKSFKEVEKRKVYSIPLIYSSVTY